MVGREMHNVNKWSQGTHDISHEGYLDKFRKMTNREDKVGEEI